MLQRPQCASGMTIRVSSALVGWNVLTLYVESFQHAEVIEIMMI